MRVLCTGAAGFVCSHIMKALAARGHDVLGIDDLSGSPTWENLDGLPANTMQFADCASLPFMRKVIERRGPFDVVVHAAANAREGASQFQPYSIGEKNLLATSAVLSASLAAGIKRFIVFSSMAIYGKQEPPFDEALPAAPEDVYGVNKAAVERITQILCEVHGASYLILRPHNVFGPGQALHDKHRNVVAIFMNRIMRGEPLFIYGDGEQTRAFSFVEDSLPCFIRAVEGVGVDSALTNVTINVGGRESIAVNTLALAVKRAMGVDENYPVVYHVDRPREVKHAFSTYALSERLLGYEERVGWEAGVIEMAQWAKSIGPRDWVNTEEMEIVSDLLPVPWREGE